MNHGWVMTPDALGRVGRAGGKSLLTGFVGEDWVSAVDLDTLDKCNGSYVSDDLRDRQDDIVWRVRRGDEVAYVYVGRTLFSVSFVSPPPAQPRNKCVGAD
jgi:hypothetical protein